MVCVPRLIPGRGFYAQISSEITSEFPGVTTVHPMKDQARGVNFDKGEGTRRRLCGEACGRRSRAWLRASQFERPHGQRVYGEGHLAKHMDITQDGPWAEKAQWATMRPGALSPWLGQACWPVKSPYM
uniref:OSJNBa0022F16.6 protein n=1 Tax=Oryza sativa subsp. japonica TaxID=39947 RepID=Q7F9K5_ORYSJ|nr:OSJNBa0022F16.6 [Oryza sativa Japonica Group]